MWTINSLRAYAIADEFRQRGIPVIMGGPHTFSYAREAAEHCDGVGIGEGETIWPIMLQDAMNGRLKKFYQAEQMQDLTALPLARHDLLDLRKYGLIKTYSIQSSRGCPFTCEFCSERFYLGPSYRFARSRMLSEKSKRERRSTSFLRTATLPEDRPTRWPLWRRSSLKRSAGRPFSLLSLQ